MTEKRFPLQPFFLTFGAKYGTDEVHPYWPHANGKGYVRVLASDAEAARITVRQHFGLAWAFIYEPIHFNPNSHYWPMGELAVIVEDVGTNPVRWLNQSQPEFYGVDPRKVIAHRIEGIRKDSPIEPEDELDYAVGVFHPDCADEGRDLFTRITEEDAHVMAFEFDWATDTTCEVCKETLTCVS